MENIDYYECGDGWLPLIEQAKTIIDKYNLTHPSNEPLKFTQIKEKWGGLRLYLNYYIPEISNKIHKIENKSFEFCEHCGNSQNIKTENTHGWTMTLCDKCRKEELEKYNRKYEKIINNI